MADAEALQRRETDPEAGTEQGEMEPLLGRPGDAAQPSGAMIIRNLSLGTGILAQLGIVLLFALVWASVFLHKLILFSGHPLAMSLALLILVQSMLVLQPTHTAEQKVIGQRIHASLNLVAFLVLVAGVTIIQVNKFSYNGPHFHSVHAYLGVITCIIILLQYLVGFTMWATPSLYGGEDNAKKVWKYHRWSGYTILVLMLGTVVASTRTEYVEKVLHVKFWATVLLGVVILVGVVPRIQKQKLGLN